MKIDSVAAQQYSSQRIQPDNPIGSTSGSTSFASILNSKTTQAAPTDSSESKRISQADFTSMTRQEMSDWMNNQISSGEMTFEESTSFLGMIIKISVATGQPVDMATDPTRINFIEKAQQGIEGALSHNKQDLAKGLQRAIEIMYESQEKAIGVNTRA